MFKGVGVAFSNEAAILSDQACKLDHAEGVNDLAQSVKHPMLKNPLSKVFDLASEMGA